MSNKPVNPWNELEGRFFKVDVGSTTADAIASDHQTGEPVVHYTTDGEIVFNGMKFCKQKEDAVSSDRRIVVHKAIPMFPRKGHIYCFQGQYIFFKIKVARINNDVTYNIPKFIDSIVPIYRLNGKFLREESDRLKSLIGSSIKGEFLNEIIASDYKYFGEAQYLLFRIDIKKQGLRKKRNEAVFVQINQESDMGGILNNTPSDIDDFERASSISIKSNQEIISLGYNITSPYYKLSDDCKMIYKYGTIERFKALAQRNVFTRIYRIKRSKFNLFRKREDGSVYFESVPKKYYCLKKKRIYTGKVAFVDGHFYTKPADVLETRLNLRNYLIQYSEEDNGFYKKKLSYTKNAISIRYFRKE